MSPPRGTDKDDTENDEHVLVGRLTRMKLREALRNHIQSNGLPSEPLNGRKELKPILVHSPGASKIPTELIDLNSDCLESILRFLRFNDLINVSSTCKYLNAAACQVFPRMFPNHQVYIDCDLFPNFVITSYSRVLDRRQCSGQNVRNFLNWFGTVITRLHISNMYATYSPYDWDGSRSMEPLIANEDIRKNLVEITFQRCGEGTLRAARPFEKVTKVIFDHYTIGREVDLEYLFPCMTKLQLVDCNVNANRNCIEKHFPNLQSLNVAIPFDFNSFTKSSPSFESIKAMFDQNPSIRRLSLCYCNEAAYDARLLYYVAMNLPFLQYLHLWHLRFTYFQTKGDIVFTSVREFTLSNYYNELGQLAHNLTTLSFVGLTQFNMLGCFNLECMPFVERHKTIDALVILPTGEHEFYPTNSDIMQFGGILPNLRKCIVDGRRLTTIGLLQFIKEYNSLMVIVIRRYTFSKEIRRLFKIRCIDLGWNVFFGFAGDEPEIVLKRIVH